MLLRGASSQSGVRLLFLAGAVSNVPEQLPPKRADDQPDNHLDQAHQEAGLPPLPLGDVASAEHDRTGADVVLGQATVDVAQDPEGDRSAVNGGMPAATISAMGNPPALAVKARKETPPVLKRRSHAHWRIDASQAKCQIHPARFPLVLLCSRAYGLTLAPFAPQRVLRESRRGMPDSRSDCENSNRWRTRRSPRQGFVLNHVTSDHGGIA